MATVGIRDHASGSMTNRRVSFWGKCQVIPPQQFFADEDEHLKRSPSFRQGKQRGTRKGSRIHIPFRSSRRRWSVEAAEREAISDQRQGPRRSAGDPVSLGGGGRAASASPFRAPSLSPTLRISQGGSANTLRRKLVSPPPPTPIDDTSCPSSPTLDEGPTASPNLTQAILALNEHHDVPPASPKQSSPPLARPVALRKPLALAQTDANKDKRRSLELPKLRVPPVVYIASQSARERPSLQKGTEEQPAAAAVLNWREEAEEGESDTDEEESTSTDQNPTAEQWSFEEEELHRECTCLNCVERMTASLAPDYDPPWTRGARRKYLADRKETQGGETRKQAYHPPIWLRCEESEAAATLAAITTREVKADEVDAKLDSPKRIRIPTPVTARHTGSTPVAGTTANAGQELVSDATMRREVEEEIRLRQEDDRLRRNRSEMRRLSADVGSGLRLGGGARAMMRQLEEAEQAERRARIERTRSPRLLDETQESPKTPMGAIHDVPAMPFIPPPRIESPVVEQSKASPQSSLSPLPNEKPSRTPSPLKRMLSNSKKKAIAPSPPAPTAFGQTSPRLVGPDVHPFRGADQVDAPRRPHSAAASKPQERGKMVRAQSMGGIDSFKRDIALPTMGQAAAGSTNLSPSLSMVTSLSANYGSPHLHGSAIPPVQGVEARLDRARSRARTSFKDLVARMKI